MADPDQNSTSPNGTNTEKMEVENQNLSSALDMSTLINSVATSMMQNPTSNSATIAIPVESESAKIKREIETWKNENTYVDLQLVSLNAQNFEAQFTVGPDHLRFQLFFNENWQPMVSSLESSFNYKCKIHFP
jgi:hypothetical protein